MPLNPDPDSSGNVILIETEAGEEVAHQLHRGEDPQDVDRYVPHFATCGRQACACVNPADSEDDQGEPAGRDELVLAVDRLTQVVDHHLARVFDQLQHIADRLEDAP
jgi:hypothetical protein